jgi:uncharacterized protein YnzC (UPF0291/DUF896 family)
MLYTVKKVEYVEGYKLKLKFNDGKVKIVDFEDRLKEAKNMFGPLKNINYFKKVKTDGTTIVWPNGLDLCPDALYERGKDVEKITRKRKSSSLLSEKPQTRVAAKPKH